MTGKFSPEFISNEESEGFAGVHFIIVVFSICDICCLTWNYLMVLYRMSVRILLSSSQLLVEIKILVSSAYIIILELLSNKPGKSSI
jgi:hypothetical protein